MEADEEFRSMKARCVTGEEVAQALIDEIYHGMSKAQSRLKSARLVADEKSGELREACSRQYIWSQHAANTKARYDALHQEQIQAVSHGQHALYVGKYEEFKKAQGALTEALDALEQAEDAVKRSEDEGRRARVERDVCVDAENSMNDLGKEAIIAVRQRQSERSENAWGEIQITMRARELMGQAGRAGQEGMEYYYALAAEERL